MITAVRKCSFKRNKHADNRKHNEYQQKGKKPRPSNENSVFMASESVIGNERVLTPTLCVCVCVCSLVRIIETPIGSVREREREKICPDLHVRHMLFVQI